MDLKMEQDKLRRDLLAAWNSNPAKDYSPNNDEVESWLKKLESCLKLPAAQSRR